MTRPKNGHIWSNTSGSTGPIFATFTPYESALRADDQSIAFFQFINGRCHGKQIVVKMYQTYQRRLIPLHSVH